MLVPAADIRLVLTTAGSSAEGERIAHALVDERLAACVNLIPGLTSVYRWQGTAETAGEILLLIKTTAAELEHVQEAVRRMHSYELPEFLVFTPGSASQPYLDWLIEQTGSPVQRRH